MIENFYYSVLCLILGLLTIYYLPLKYELCFNVICLFCMGLVCVLLAWIVYLSFEIVLSKAPTGDLPKSIGELLKKPVITQIYSYFGFAWEIKYICCGVVV